MPLDQDVIAIPVSIDTGASPITAIYEMSALATRLNIRVVAEINGVWVNARPLDEPADLLDRFRRELARRPA